MPRRSRATRRSCTCPGTRPTPTAVGRGGGCPPRPSGRWPRSRSPSRARARATVKAKPKPKAAVVVAVHSVAVGGGCRVSSGTPSHGLARRRAASCSACRPRSAPSRGARRRPRPSAPTSTGCARAATCLLTRCRGPTRPLAAGRWWATCGSGPPPPSIPSPALSPTFRTARTRRRGLATARSSRAAAGPPRRWWARAAGTATTSGQTWTKPLPASARRATSS
mmetsp:Transcript_18207/g.53875  ORF Transcript_18207/g.53875 Transcript_18207/m.53875 type:complete len:223 (-) Transcript_18207:134-802(-)